MASKLSDSKSPRSEWLERRKNGHVVWMLNIYEKPAELETVVLNPEKPQDILDSKELTKKLEKDPKRYMTARLQIGSDRFRTTYAVVQDKQRPDIQVKGNIRRAFSGDTVVIDLQPNSLAIEGNVGYFVGVLNQFADPRERQYVCEVNPQNPSIMVPIDRSLPRIRNKNYYSRDKTAGNKIPIYKKHKLGGGLQEINKLSLQDALNKKCLFVVEFLKWDKGHQIPLGYVMRTMPRGDTPDMSKKILLTELGIRENFSYGIKEIVQQSIPDNKQRDRELAERRRVTNAFTIDPSGARDLDDAISVDDIADGMFRVGIHIADVSFFVQRGTALDREARQRGVSYYTGRDGEENIPMLPRELSENILSLLPNKDRLTVSVFVTLNSEGEVVGEEEILRTVTRSCCRLSYSQAQQKIDMEEHAWNKEGVPERVCRDIRTLHSLVVNRRWQRLREASFDHSNNREETEAHELIEELMILANHTVGEILHRGNERGTPFRTQDEPKVDRLNEWASTYGSFAKYSLPLRPHLESEDITPDVREKIEYEESTIYIKREVWDQILQAARAANYKKVTRLLCDPFCSPQIATARQNLMKIQCKSQYQANVEEPYHHTLKLRSYVHFTSPIRRYIDIEVHRLLLELVQENGAIVGQQSLSDEEMTSLCQSATLKKDNSGNYEKESERIYFASKLNQKSLTGKFVIDKIEEHAFTIQPDNPEQEQLLGNHKTIAFDDLSPYSKSDDTDETQTTTLTWRFRMYLAPSTIQDSAGSKMDDFMELRKDADTIYSMIENNYRFEVHKIERETWQTIIDAIMESASDRLLDRVVEANQMRDDDDDGGGGGGGADKTLNNASKLGEDIGHFYEITWKFKQYDMICFQLHSRLHRGMIRPDEQFFKISPHFGICLEHRKDPRGCFACSATGQVNTAEVYRSIPTYIHRWRPLLEMETATGAVRQEDGYSLKLLPVSWTQKNDAIKGQFTLPGKYCKKRQITFHRGDFTCVKISCGSDVTSAEISLLPYTKATNNESTVTWIGHGFVERCQIKEDNEDKTDNEGKLIVFFKIQQMSSEFPHELQGSICIVCDVDIIYQPIPLRRMKEALNVKLEASSELVQKICLGRKTRKVAFPLPAERDLSLAAHFETSGFHALNDFQKDAVRQALQKNFSLIQGPPGTGKTVTGVHIAYWFAKLNREGNRRYASEEENKPRNAPPQVLYCGPSNKSVDVVTEYLLRIPKMKDKILRVHGKLIEETEYPIPNKIRISKPTVSEDELKIPEGEVKEVSLHHFIRNETSSPLYSKTLAEFERKFAEFKESMDGCVVEYRRLMAEAKRKAVRKNKPRMTEVSLRSYIRHRFSPYSEKLAELEKKFAGLKKTMDEDVEKYCKVIAEAETWAIQRTGKEIILCTCSRAGSKTISSSKGCDNIQQCIIDECGMCMEPEVLVPMTSSEAKQFVLIGDHKQLQPIVTDRQAKTFGLQVSMFERLSNRAIMLKIQYRMHPSICEFPSEQFYNGKLETPEVVKSRRTANVQIWPALQNKDLRCAFCHVEGEEKSTVISTAESNVHSKYNEEEAAKAVEVAKYLVDNHGREITNKNVVILTPYRQQRKIIQDLLRDAGKDILVTTIIKSQGSEWDYVILSLVRSLPEEELEPEPSSSWFVENLGFITDDHQINVALTRAKHGLVIIGNKNLVSYSPTWKALIDQYERKSCVVEGSQWPVPE